MLALGGGILLAFGHFSAEFVDSRLNCFQSIQGLKDSSGEGVRLRV